MLKTLLISLIFGACFHIVRRESKDFTVFTFKEIPLGYQYNNQVISYKSKTYLLEQAAQYGIDSLTDLEVYKSEGSMHYSTNDLLQDTLLLQNLHIALHRNIALDGDRLIDQNQAFAIQENRDDSVFCFDKNRLLIYVVKPRKPTD